MKFNDQTYSQKYLTRQKDLAKMLGMSVDAMRKLQKNDSTFAKPIKFGTTRQAPVFYMTTEVEAWILSKKSP